MMGRNFAVWKWTKTYYTFSWDDSWIMELQYACMFASCLIGNLKLRLVRTGLARLALVILFTHVVKTLLAVGV